MITEDAVDCALWVAEHTEDAKAVKGPRVVTTTCTKDPITGQQQCVTVSK